MIWPTPRRAGEHATSCRNGGQTAASRCGFDCRWLKPQVQTAQTASFRRKCGGTGGRCQGGFFPCEDVRGQGCVNGCYLRRSGRIAAPAGQAASGVLPPLALSVTLKRELEGCGLSQPVLEPWTESVTLKGSRRHGMRCERLSVFRGGGFWHRSWFVNWWTRGFTSATA